MVSFEKITVCGRMGRGKLNDLNIFNFFICVREIESYLRQ